MKKDPLTIAILVCLVIIIILLILLLVPSKEEKNSNSASKKDVKTEDKIDKELEDIQSTKKSLFTDTSQANNEEEIVSYVEKVEDEIDKVISNTNDKKSIKERLENTFITLTDFIFYDGKIKGMTFNELTDSAKEKVLTAYEKIDSKIESYLPNYKENIKSTAKKGYTTVISKATELKDAIISKYKEKVGEDAYNNVVDSFTEDKNRFQDAYSPYVEKGKEIGSQAIEKGKEAIGKLDSWYQGFKESRE